MTKINKIVFNGFKSFGKRTEMLLGDEFNVIVGPNGSGKSNVLDGLCFVLGKSSSKSLRAEKSANLIYNGGKTKKGANKGEVSIYFDNSKKIFPTEQDAVKISRIVKKNGQSVYKINDKTRTRQQILDLLAIARINPDGYNIILQGDIVRLVEMSSTERRQIIEEIAGIGVYEEKKQKACRELEKVQDRLNKADIILKERSAYLKELKKDRDQALKYKDLNDKISVNKASYLKRKIDKKEDEKLKFDKQVNNLTEELDKQNDKIKKHRDDISDKKKQIKEISKEVEEKGEKDQIDLQKKVEKLRVEIATHKERISSCKNEISRINQRKVQLQNNLEEINDKIETLNSKKSEFLEEKKRQEETKKDLEDKISKFKKKHKLGDEAEKIEKEIEQIDVKIEENQKVAQELREKQQELLREKDKLEFQIQTMDDKISKVLEVEKEHEAEIKDLKQKKTEFKKASVELNQLLNSDSKAAGQVSRLRQQLYEDREKLSKLEIANMSAQEKMGENIAIKKVLENKNKFGGVYGVVSELGKVEKKFSRALDIAAGRKLNSIVIEDDLTAAKCIKYLKSNRFGVATFFPLNKMKGHAKPDKSLLKQKGVHGFAIDLISYDPKFKDIFKHIFGDTLVVENIETARNIGIKKVRMVTLDGDLAETSGAMIGGFRQKKKSGGFKDKDLTKDIESLSSHVDKAEQELGRLESERQQNEQRIQNLRELKATLEGEIIKIERGLHLDSGDLEASKAFKEECKAKLKKADDEMDQVVSEISDINRELATFKMDRHKLKEKINELKNPRLLAELNTYEQKRSEVVESLIKVDAEIKNFDVQIKDILGRDQENTSRIVKDMDKESKIFKDEITALTKKISGQEKKLKQKEEDQKKFYKSFRKLYEKRNNLNDDITKIESTLIKIEESSRKVELKMNTISLENAKVKAELAGLESEFEPFKGVEIDTKKNEEQLKKEISQFEKMKDQIGNINMKALEIYESVEKEYNVLIEKKEKLEVEKNSVIGFMEELDQKKAELFLKNLNQVNTNFQRIFSELSTKGEAELYLENPEEVFDGGLRIKVRLSGEKFLDIRSLSGGEKTMTALAFLFAIQDHEPASFYVLDEVDAALDKANSEKLAKLVRSYCGNAQYLVISHNDAVISEADTLYGISMDEHGVSKVVSIKI